MTLKKPIENKHGSAKLFGLAVGAVIEDSTGRLLLMKRSVRCNHFAGQWETPGGKVKDGEPFDFALLREVEEETGLRIELTGVLGAAEFGLPHIHVVILYMRARIVTGEIKISNEHSEFAWVSWGELNDYDLTPGLQDMMSRRAAPR